jgi:hypothetical protein
VGSALLTFGTDRCDAHQCYAWVNSSMAGYPAFRKAGFEDVGMLEVDVTDD